MYLDVYIGWLGDDETLDWGGEWSLGNLPNPKSPFFPNGHRAFSLLVDKIEAGEFTGEKVDWGGSAAAVTKQQIISFMDEHYSEDRKPWKGCRFSPPAPASAGRRSGGQIISTHLPG